MRNSSRERMRPAISLVELIVVVSVLVILVGLSAVALQSAREASRRNQCQNRLRQLALGTQSFVASHRHFPGNGWGFRWLGQTERGTGPDQPGGWAFQLLPFVEITLPQQPAGSPEDIRAAWTQLSMPLFRCPSRSAGALTKHTELFTPNNGARVTKVAKTDFAICEGDYQTDTDGGPSSIEQGEDPGYRWTDVSKATGVSFLRSQIKPSQINDGLSLTYLIGEKQVERGHYNDGQDFGYDQSLLSGVDLDLNRWVNRQPAGDWQPGMGRQFGSAHPAGFSMTFCDGSVRRLSYQIDLVVHARLGNRLDEHQVSIP